MLPLQKQYETFSNAEILKIRINDSMYDLLAMMAQIMSFYHMDKIHPQLISEFKGGVYTMALWLQPKIKTMTVSWHGRKQTLEMIDYFLVNPSRMSLQEAIFLLQALNEFLEIEKISSTRFYTGVMTEKAVDKL